MIAGSKSRRSLVALTAALFLLCVGIAGAGYGYYRSQKSNTESDTRDQLSAIADLKVQQVRAWRQERMTNALMTAQNALLVEAENPGTDTRMKTWMEFYRAHRGLTAVAVLDRSGRVLAAAADGPGLEPGRRVDSAPMPREPGEVEMTDLYRGPGESIFIDILTPLPLRRGQHTGNVLLFRTEAASFLYAMIQSWPTPSRTAESLLVRKEGESIRYLSELRQRKGAALNLVSPIRSDSPAALAFRGVEGVWSGLDYRGVNVLAALRKIPETNWCLVAKIDTDEVYAPLRRQGQVLGVEVALLLASCLIIFALLWRIQNNRIQREQAQTEATRRAHEERQAFVGRHMSDIVLLVDERGRIVEANDRAAATYGYTPEEMIQLSIRDLVDERELAGLAGTLQDLWENGSQTIEGRHRRKDGSSLPVEVSTRRFDEGQRKFGLSIVRDITERKQDEGAVQRANRALRILSASNQAVVRSGDERELCSDICQAITAAGGYPLAWIGFAEYDSRKTVSTIAAAGAETTYLDHLEISWADEPNGRGPVGTSIRTGKIVVCHDVQTDASTRPWWEIAAKHWFRSVVALPLRCEGTVIGQLAIYATECDAFNNEEMRLINELAGDLAYGIEVRRRELKRVEAERGLTQSNAEFQALFDTVNDMILIRSLDGRILEANAMASVLLGHSRDELLKMTVRAIDSTSDPELLARRMEKLATGGECLFETAVMRKDGSRVPVEVRCKRFEYRQAVAVLSTSRDITERKRAESRAHAYTEELERAKTAAESANRAKSEFLANMSHEIRTPMNGIIGMTELLLDSPLTPAQCDCAETVRSSADGLLSILNGILDFSKIEAGKMEIRTADFDLIQLLKETSELMAPQAQAKGLRFSFQAGAESRWVHSDAGRIRQIVLNLLSNAVKFTESGSVALRIVSSDAGKAQKLFTISVSDTGIGIAPELLPSMFNRFMQADSSLVKKYSGTGLGLAISRQLAQLLGGDLNVESELGQGSTFVLTLPLPQGLQPLSPAASPKQTASRPDAVPGKCRRVLFAEDNPVNQKIGRRVLEKLGCTVELAVNGRQAADMAAASSYDLIFMDCGMPEMDGYAATREIRAHEALGARVPIIALTAHAMEGARELCLEAGMDDFLPKPTSVLALRQAVEKWRP